MGRKDRSTSTSFKKSKSQEAEPNVDALLATGVQFHQNGRLNDAELTYRKILTINPFHSDSYNLLGVIALQVGRFDMAVDLISQAITLNDKFYLYHSNLGNAWKGMGRYDAAIDCYKHSLVLKKDNPEAYVNMGAALHDKRAFAEAADCFRKAIALNANIPEAHNNLGNVLVDLEQYDDAIASFRRAIALRDNYAEVYNNLSTAYKKQGKLEEALRNCRAALDFRPDFAEAYSNYSGLLKILGRSEEALEFSRRALELNPGLPEVHYNLGTALAEQGKIDEAIPLFKEAIKLRSDFPNAHYNLATSLLAKGDYEQGWLEYEWRWKTRRLIMAKRLFKQPQWRGEAAEGRRLLIHAEQGLGDTIQFCRYASLAAQAGWKVILEVQKPLLRLLKNLPYVDQVVAFGDLLPPFDLHCPLLSMPLGFKTTLTTIPCSAAYLKAEPELMTDWKKRLASAAKKGPKIGLAWAGNTASDADQQRSMSSDHFAPLLKLKNMNFVSLQKGGPAAPANRPLIDFMDEIEDFAETAALITQLDLVIAVDTAVVHLAAALGKPVWLLDRFDPDWRWLLGRRDSPWYPSLRIYRQPHSGDWTSVVADVMKDLGNTSWS